MSANQDSKDLKSLNASASAFVPKPIGGSPTLKSDAPAFVPSPNPMAINVNFNFQGQNLKSPFLNTQAAPFTPAPPPPPPSDAKPEPVVVKKPAEASSKTEAAAETSTAAAASETPAAAPAPAAEKPKMSWGSLMKVSAAAPPSPKAAPKPAPVPAAKAPEPAKAATGKPAAAANKSGAKAGEKPASGSKTAAAPAKKDGRKDAKPAQATKAAPAPAPAPVVSKKNLPEIEIAAPVAPKLPAASAWGSSKRVIEPKAAEPVKAEEETKVEETKAVEEEVAPVEETKVETSEDAPAAVETAAPAEEKTEEVEEKTEVAAVEEEEATEETPAVKGAWGAKKLNLKPIETKAAAAEPAKPESKAAAVPAEEETKTAPETAEEDSEDEAELPVGISVQVARASHAQHQISSVKEYTLEQLLAFRDLPECKTLPEEHSIPHALVKGNGVVRPDRNNKRNARANGGRGKKEPATPLPQTGANSWAAKSRAEKVEDPKVVLHREMRSVLNKITLEKFEGLVAKLLALEKDSEDLSVLCQLIFEKAIAQHHFIPMYTDLVTFIQGSEMEKEKARDPNANPTKTAFRSQLLSTVQRQFQEVNVNGSNEYAERLAAEPENEEVAELYFKQKQKMLGNMKFIASLISRKLLPTKVTSLITSEMFNKRTDEALESLVSFLQVLGPDHDATKEAKNYDAFFDRLAKYTSSEYRKDGDEQGFKAGQRIICLIYDLLDLRKSNWESVRTQTNSVMKLEDIKKMHRQEEEKEREQSRINAERVRRQQQHQRRNGPEPVAAAPTKAAAKPTPVAKVFTLESAKKQVDSIVRMVRVSDGPQASVDEILEMFTGMHVDPQGPTAEPLLLDTYYRVFSDCSNAAFRKTLFEWLARVLLVSAEWAQVGARTLQAWLDDEESAQGFAAVKEDFPKVGELICDDFLEAVFDHSVPEQGRILLNAEESQVLRDRLSPPKKIVASSRGRSSDSYYSSSYYSDSYTSSSFSSRGRSRSPSVAAKPADQE